MSVKRFQRSLVRVLTVLVVISILACLGLYLYRMFFGYNRDSSLFEADLAAGVKADENITNIALFGLDVRPEEENCRSDTMMIVTVDNTRGKIKLISLMRDSLVSIDGYGETKLNEAYFYGGPCYTHHKRELRHGYYGLYRGQLQPARRDHQRDGRR